MADKNTLKYVPISDIRENPVALRPVNQKDETFLTLVDSVRTRGVLNPINVREMRDPETGQKYYSLVDGLHRWTAAQHAGLAEIPVHIITANDADVLELQLIANAQKVETRPVEYSQQLARILANNPTMTSSELAAKLNMSPSWIGQRLGLVKLDAKVAPLVDDNQIVLSNAYAMAKLPPEEQTAFIERAMTMPPAEFTPTVNARVKEIRDAKREGRAPKSQEFVPVPHLRKLGELKEQADNPNDVVAYIREKGYKNPHEIVQATLNWALHLDDASVAAAKAKAEQRDREEAERKAARKREQDEKKLKAAKEAQETAQANA